mmetsp:Transcript_5561/g.6004  ORF Transcript_5561/g.6004 Transcript_5561/m.6004 type:complete len:263 (+) Transcript_5561:39-827(+)
MATRDIEGARKAFEIGDVYLSLQAHEGFTSMNENTRMKADIKKVTVVAGFQAITTTLCIVSAALGSGYSPTVTLMFGLAIVFGESIIMGIDRYLQTKSELEYHLYERKREEWEVDNNPEGEKKEMVEIYTNKGIPEEDAMQMTDILSRHKTAWIDIMMVEELGIIENHLTSPLKSALASLISFAAFAAVPLLPFIFGFVIKSEALLYIFSYLVSGVALYAMGNVKSQVNHQKAGQTAIECIVLGAIACVVAFFVGLICKSHL